MKKGIGLQYGEVALVKQMLQELELHFRLMQILAQSRQLCWVCLTVGQVVGMAAWTPPFCRILVWPKLYQLDCVHLPCHTLFSRLMSAPFCISVFTTSLCPLPQATWSGVTPSCMKGIHVDTYVVTRLDLESHYWKNEPEFYTGNN